MKASIAHGWRPSVVILGKDSKSVKVTRTDISLARAYQRFLNEICSQCGGPKYLCHNSNNEIQYKLARDECAATQMVESEQARLSKDKNYKGYGIRIYAEPFLTEDAVEAGKEFSDYRRPYLVERAKAQGLIPDED
jgi:hypothetical protein